MLKKQKHFETQPIWYHPEAPLGSAVRYLASLTPQWSWVGIYKLSGKKLKLGPFIGVHRKYQKISSDSQFQLAVWIHQPMGNLLTAGKPLGRPLGRIDIHSFTQNAFGLKEKEIVQKIAGELGTLWPE